MKLSLCASAIRPHLWEDLLNSLKGSKYEYEVVFCGHVDQSLVKEMFSQYPELRYITTGEIKPSMCYHISMINAKRNLICYIADDCVFSAGFVDKVVDYWESLNNEKAILSCKTNENNQNETMQHHRFFGRNMNTPLMAPIGVLSRDYYNKLGGYDRRYIAGQAENDLVMRIISDGGRVYLYEDVCVNIEHINKHGSTTDFWSGYNEDREQLENSWCVGGYQKPPKPLVVLDGLQPPYTYWPISNSEVTLVRNDKFEPYAKDISLTESEEPRGIWK